MRQYSPIPLPHRLARLKGKVHRRRGHNHQTRKEQHMFQAPSKKWDKTEMQTEETSKIEENEENPATEGGHGNKQRDNPIRNPQHRGNSKLWTGRRTIHSNRRQIKQDLQMPTGHTTWATEVKLLQHKLRHPARRIDIVPGIKTESLISMAKFVDADFMAVFDRRKWRYLMWTTQRWK